MVAPEVPLVHRWDFPCPWAMGAALPREAGSPDDPMDPPPHKRFHRSPLRAAVALGILLSPPRAPVATAVNLKKPLVRMGYFTESQPFA
eukprot:COSAG01_NODE_27766_length_677_cov_1.437716_1_plen_88_part_01